MAAAEYLVIGGKDEESALAALAVAADIAGAKNAAVDIATSPQYAPVVRLGKTPRQVLEVDVAPLSSPDISLDEIKSAPVEGVKKLFSFAGKAAKTAAASAMTNLRQYRALVDTLRLARYNAALDLDGNAAGLFAVRAANAAEAYGFAAENIPDAAPGASLLYHQSRAVPQSLPRRSQCRRLASDLLNYTALSTPEWNFTDAPPPADMPESPFILLAGEIPEPFLAVLRETGLPLYAPVSPPDILAAARACQFAVGAAVSLPAAAGATTLFVGGAAHAPPEARTVESPSAMREILAAPSPDKTETDSEKTVPVGGLRIAK